MNEEYLLPLDEDGCCDVCGTRGWDYDDLSSAMGGKWWRNCNCAHGARESAKDDEEYRRKQARSPFKTCPTCNGDGVVKKNKEELVK